MLLIIVKNHHLGKISDQHPATPCPQTDGRKTPFRNIVLGIDSAPFLR